MSPHPHPAKKCQTSLESVYLIYKQVFTGCTAATICFLRIAVYSKPAVSSGPCTHTHFWLVQPPRWPAYCLPLFAGQLITLINISLQVLAASQTSPLLGADCSRTFLFFPPPTTTLLGPNMFSSLPQTCTFLSGLLFSSCADL